MSIEIKVPDIGDFSEVPVVSILVSVGDTIAEEDPSSWPLTTTGAVMHPNLRTEQ